MRNVFIVTQEQADLARRAEALLVGLPEASGILFASAKIREAASPSQWGMDVVVGCARNLEVAAVEALVWAVLEKDPPLEAIRHLVTVQAYRGVARSS